MLYIYSYPARTQGRTTGRTGGDVLRYTAYTNGEGSKLTTGCDTEDGDSGAPVFEPPDTNGDTYIYSTHAQGTDYDGDGIFDDSRGNTAFWIEEELNLTI